MQIAGKLESVVRRLGLFVALKRLTGGLKDSELYRPRLSPWRDRKFLQSIEPFRPYTLVSPDRLYVLKTLVLQTLSLPGETWECGVYRGGTAMLIASLICSSGSPEEKTLRLFDTFQGMPETDAVKDFHRKGDFSETSLESVRGRLPQASYVQFHAGLIPATFHGLESSRIAFAHVDVDVLRSVTDCCSFIYPRMMPGGFMLFDDYGFPSCPGAREAVDNFFSGKPEQPLVLATGQAVVFIGGRAPERTPEPGGKA